jgi:hypothetical protein
VLFHVLSPYVSLSPFLKSMLQHPLTITSLDAEHFAIPWTFIVLLAVSLATIVSLTVTIVLYNFTYLSPRYNLLTNGAISAVWTMGFAMLTWSVSTSHVLAKACTGPVWGGEAGAGVCRDYKALWSMTLVGTYVFPFPFPFPKSN